MPIKMPTYTQLSAEQKQILEEHDLDANILVIGPPGTGKTVIAMHRAEQMALVRLGAEADEQNGKSVRMIMYNKVLSKYSEGWDSDDFSESVDVLTYHSWANRIWKRTGGRGFPPSRSVGDTYDIDWKVLGTAMRDARVTVGSLVIDEAQDLPPDFYTELSKCLCLEAGAGVSIFADENQSLKPEMNSSIDQIRKQFATLNSIEQCTLSENYRNTYEIAELSARFYVGLQTGRPKLPEQRRGERPRLVGYQGGESGMSKSVATFARNNPSASILVILPSRDAIKKWHESLTERLPKRKIGAYLSGSKDKEFGVSSMNVGDDGSITLVHWQSMKGLEADAVFVPHIEKFDLGGDTDRHERMRLYVMCSRARSTLEMQYDLKSAKNKLVRTIQTLADGVVECQTR
jgi:DNA helicase IV